MKDKILLIDALNQIHRANITFGKPPPQDEIDYTIVYNFFKSFRFLVQEFDPKIICFVLEGHPQFRYDLNAEYKANRIVKTGDDKKIKSNERFHFQKRIIKDLLQHLPVKQFVASNYECDDVIASLATSLKDEDVTIISNDSDYIQLLQNDINVKIYNPIKKEYMKAPDYHYLVWKSLAGDKSDNIKGVVGPAKATKLSNDPTLLKAFLSIKENEELFYNNYNLIKFAEVKDEEMQITEGITNFDYIKEQFTKMKFDSMLEEKAWNRFINTFNKIS